MQVIPDFASVRPEIKPEKKEMLSWRKEGEKYFFRINSSSLGAMLSCGRKAYYDLEQELKPKSESPALTFGKAIHKAMEVFYSRPWAERTIPTRFNDRSNLMAFGTEPEGDDKDHFLFDAIRAFVAEADVLKGLPDTDMRSIPNGIWILQYYFKDYMQDVYEVYCDEDGPVTERSFTLNIHESETLSIEIFGQIDVVLQHSVNKSIIPGDHKTVSQLGKDFYNRLKPNHQYTCYILGAQEVLGLPGQSFLINGIQVKPKPKTKRGTPPSFVRQITDRTSEDIEEFKNTVHFAIRNYIHWLETDKWPLGDVNYCSFYGGCKYLEVCSAPKTLRNNIIESKFNSVKDL